MADGFRCRMLSWEEVYSMAEESAEGIRKSGFAPDAIVAVTRGGWVPAMLLSDLLGVRDLLSVRVEHWGVTAEKDARAVVRHPLNADLSGKRVLVVDDLTDSGDSLVLAIGDVKRAKAADVRTATLIHKRQSQVKPDYFALETDKWEWIIFPWNLREDLGNLARKLMSEGVPKSGLASAFRERFGLELDAALLENVL